MSVISDVEMSACNIFSNRQRILTTHYPMDRNYGEKCNMEETVHNNLLLTRFVTVIPILELNKRAL